ncbi:hypothetical protein BK026_06925 [Alteromonas sp. V450]|uniref:hypothetical protein n=1 Tax=Alteromonas sp. V450 TaxID=1912139 RepID=UPI00091D24DE|nr:hypothetical protein [Alteromonas sp. V450]OJF68541.1 hypothetical protein BK026_06925 [Alteromonas sp. V450]
MNKKALTLGLILSSVVLSVYAGVSNIRSNGNISGVPSYLVECSSGSSYVIYKKNGTWYSGGIGHMGNKYDSWSKNDVAKYLCS